MLRRSGMAELQQLPECKAASQEREMSSTIYKKHVMHVYM